MSTGVDIHSDTADLQRSAPVSDSDQPHRPRDSQSSNRRPRNHRSKQANSHTKAQTQPEATNSTQSATHTIMDQVHREQQHNPEDESQDSNHPNNYSTNTQKRNKAKKNRQPKNQSVSGIQGLDGASSPRPRTASHAYNDSQGHIATPIKQAYAGPTFHASPAASSLPMPKFLSRSVPRSSSIPSTLQAQPHQDAGRDDSSVSTSEEQEVSKEAVQPKQAREQSPLDVFFNAHRAERELTRSKDAVASRSQTSLTPESAEWRRYQPPPRPLQRTSSGHSGRDIFMMELDGTGETDGSDDGTVSQIPFKQRMNNVAARSTSSLVQSETLNNTDEEDRRLEQSQALKRLLMSHEREPNSLPSAIPNSEQQNTSNTPSSADISRVPPPPVQGNSVPLRHGQTQSPQSTPPPPAMPQSSEVKQMESNLRRMLKLE